MQSATGPGNTRQWTIKEVVANYDALPKSGQSDGDVYITADGLGYVWNGADWGPLGQLGGLNQTELTAYSAHEAVAGQATAFLTYIITTATLYTTVTGATWGIVLANTFSASPVTRLWLLGLHVLLSFGTAVGIWGVSNNFIQRLNLARWLGVAFWPNIERMGGPEKSWKGVPDANLEVLTFNERRKKRREKRRNWLRDQRSTHPRKNPKWSRVRQAVSWLNFWLLYHTVGRLDLWLRYRALPWPSLRHQRIWALLPFLAGGVSMVFMLQITKAGDQHKLICDQVARTLSFADNAPVPSGVFDRARYLFDKTGCELSHIHMRPPEP